MTLDATTQQQKARTDDCEPFGWVWRTRPDWPWDLITDPATVADISEIDSTRNVKTEIVALVTRNSRAHSSPDDSQPFGWVWRVSATSRWHFTTDPEHIEYVRQMATDRSKTWDITPLFKHDRSTRSTEFAG